MAKMGCRLLYENLADAGTLSASSQVATLPVTKLQDHQRTMTWQATGCADEYVDLACNGDNYAAAIALVNHNLSGTAQLVITAGSSPGASDLGTYELEVWPALFGAGEGAPGEHGAGGALSDDEITLMYTDPVTVAYFGPVAAPFYRARLLDPDNQAGYVRAGRLFLGPYLELPQVFDWGYSPQRVSLSKKTYSDWGNRWVDRRRWRRSVPLDFKRLPTDVVMWDVKRLQMLAYEGAVILDGKPWAASALERQEMLIYGELTDTAATKMDFEDQGEFPLSVQELL